jgi:protease-4
MLEQPFLRDTLELIGVKARIDKREEYKSAADMFTAASMSAPVRQNLQRLVDSYTMQLAAGIAEGRGVSAEEARALIDKGPFIAIEAQQQRLVNKLAYWDEVKTSAEDRANNGKTVSLADYIAALPEPPSDAPKIAVVYGVGPVELATTEEEPAFGGARMASHAVAEAIADAARDKDVKAIIFRIDSPGGSYVASDTIWREVDRARKQGKPVIVSMGDVAASGGYFVAAAAKSIVAQPGTITGSIGVFGGKFVVHGLWDKLGLHWDSVQGGRHADFQSPNHDYSDEEWAALQASLDRIYFDFTHKVAEGRSLPVDKVLEEAKGQVWSGADAQANGLVDQLGGFQAALALARDEGGVAKDAAVRLVEYPKAKNEFDKLFSWLNQLGVDSESLQSLAASGRGARIEAAIERLLGPAAAAQSGPQLRAPEIEVR